MNNRLIAMLAALGMIGSLGIDTYLPAFDALATHFNVRALVLQQSLSGYLMGMAVMMLFYGTLSDCFGRRAVVLWAVAIFTVGSFGAASSQDITQLLAWRAIQGLAAGAGSVIGRAIIQDRCHGADAMRSMSQVIMAFALAPAIAPLIGGWMLEVGGWQLIFVFLGVFGAVLWLCCWRGLEETLPVHKRQPFSLRPLLRVYLQVMSDRGFVFLTVAGGFGFAVFSLYIGAAASFVIKILGRDTSGFGWLFVPLVAGMVSGSWVGGRLANKVHSPKVILAGYVILLLGTTVATIYASLAEIRLPWAVIPLGVSTFGLALINPGLALAAMQIFPNSCGLASSLNGFINTLFFAGFAGGIAPLVASNPQWLGLATIISVVLSMLCWRLSYFVAKLPPHAGKINSSSEKIYR
ncbi:Bcr/CflA subfamily drug resistance transporter [Pseudomonas sp. M47T1]|uniref:multidrug effflux MFS transporter n=1 Tax=Pseudomonas sp. M47T1 TaxID=1179778 RepID=UPI0002607341|nr:multidrug effflux MFS transporter [Pseudomonas sp. M47T1]EIK94142.1 Bcr/CflA subfamily drug resistance transporter [Pseudomonas sp. M47T1]